ncbi:helix-turn-helix transcriptional regulator [Brevibacillus borstelensis]|uniref:helix-turn-helix transcriptional regulator n=1 Tax=Brevibacillus borstelensis TaxID=45462 RepID=UPI002E1B8E01|nr:helix-turn-helix transcriptional regulator [Brevibacillus borstelensis]
MLISVKAARVNAKMSQKTVAKELGLSVTGYSKKERGVSSFYAHEIMILAELFGVKYENFFEVRCRKKTQDTA